MKKNLFFVAALFAGSVAFAQTTEVKDANDVVFTPQAGDWAVGFNASPIFDYVGNMFNGNTSNSLNFAGNNSFVNPTQQAIYGKYFKDENTAFRGSLRLMTSSRNTVGQIDTATVSNSTPSYVENTYKRSGAGVVLGFGLEKRKGHNKLQGYYGGEALITFGGSTPKLKNTYAVDLDSTSIANNVTSGTYQTAENGRVLTSKGGATFGFGVRGFIGAEYFFAPKISIAAEYGWGLSLTSTAGTTTVTENFGYETTAATTESFYTKEVTTGKTSTFAIDTDNLGGAIRLMFHF